MSATPQLVSDPLAAKRKLAAELLRKKLAEPKHFPISYAQQRLWFLDQLMSSSAAYNIPFIFRLEGQLSVPPVHQTLNEVVWRHAVLRTRFHARKCFQVHELLACHG